MTDTPIADHINGDDTPEHPRHHGGGTIRNRDRKLAAAPDDGNNTEASPNFDGFVARPQNRDYTITLLDAQQGLISAHHEFLHTSNTQTLLVAQRNFIAAQDEVLYRLGVYG
jgi:hypothetical protein